MWDHVQSLANEAYRLMSRLDRQEWILVFVGVVVIGAFCLRGFGSRTNY